MTRLELVRRLHSECRMPGNGPSTTLNQTGVYLKLVNWIDDSWLDIQNWHDQWRFMWATDSFTTRVGVYDYDLDTETGESIGVLATNSFKIYDSDDGVTSEGGLPFHHYDYWRANFSAGFTGLDNNTPGYITLLPNEQVRVGPPPDKATYVISFDHYRDAQIFSADADTPTGLPTRFHRLIVYRAMMMFGLDQEAPTIFASGEGRFENMMGDLERSQLAPAGFGLPLA